MVAGRFRILIAAALIVVTLSVLAGVAIEDRYRAAGPLTADARVVIPKGAGVSAIASLLKEAGVISSEAIFLYGVHRERAALSLHAGEYLFPPRIAPDEVITWLRSGRVLVRRLTVPEGLTTAQILMLLRSAEGLEGEITARPGEGTLLPATYHYHAGDSPDRLLQRMEAALQQAVTELWEHRDANLPIATPEEAIILASIVEKETSTPDERPRIAAVFLNRLRLGMRLQADPTVAYGIHLGEGSLERALTVADLRRPSPFNTYVIDGLPPAPISNPGRAALAAVLNPAATDELYFVADGSGGHAFSRTLEEHNLNVARWRALMRARKED